MTVHLHTSKDGLSWTKGQVCTAPWDNWNGGYFPWHIAAKPNYPEQKIDFLIAGWPKHGKLKDCVLYYACAPMTEPANLSMPLPGPVLKPSTQGQWDNSFIYRSSFVIEPGEQPAYRIWYSACSKKRTWHLGYTEGKLGNTSLS